MKGTERAGGTGKLAKVLAISSIAAMPDALSRAVIGRVAYNAGPRPKQSQWRGVEDGLVLQLGVTTRLSQKRHPATGLRLNTRCRLPTSR